MKEDKVVLIFSFLFDSSFTQQGKEKILTDFKKFLMELFLENRRKLNEQDR